MHGNNKPLSKSQVSLHQQILSIIGNNQASGRSLLSNPFTYFVEAFRRRIFNKKCTSHEACILITEEVRDIVITSGATADDFAIVIGTISADLSLMDGEVIFFFILAKQLVRKVCEDLLTRNREAFSSGDIERVVSSGEVVSSCQLGDVSYYVKFLEEEVNYRHSTAAVRAAHKLLKMRCLLTAENLLARALAYAVVRIGSEKHLATIQAQFSIEFASCVSLNVVGVTQDSRAAVMELLDEQYRIQHPILSMALNITNKFNTSASNMCTGVYISAIVSIFLTRLYSRSAFFRMQHDLSGAANLSFYSTQHYTPYSTNGSTSVSTNITIPEDISEFFPESFGIYNGLPSYLPTVLATTQLFFALPSTFLTQHKRKFILRQVQNKSAKTEVSGQDYRNFSLALIVRWASNVVMQPLDIITHPIKHSVFQWSVFRLFTPLACLEEPLKEKLLSNSLEKQSHRDRGGKFSTDLRLMYAAGAIILALEMTDKYLNFPSTACTVLIKCSRLLAVLVPVAHNSMKDRLVYSRGFERFVLANAVRALSSPAVLPLYDQLGDKLRYVSLLSATDALLTVNAELVAGSVMSQVAGVEKNIATCSSTIENAIFEGKNSSLVVVSTELQIQLVQARSTVTFLDMMQKKSEKKNQKKPKQQNPTKASLEAEERGSTGFTESELARYLSIAPRYTPPEDYYSDNAQDTAVTARDCHIAIGEVEEEPAPTAEPTNHRFHAQGELLEVIVDKPRLAAMRSPI
ncbi:MAG: Cpg1 family polymorphic protein [Ehrlichia sp.]